MNCTEYRRIASARLDGQSSADETRRLEAHLGECEACRRAERAMRAVDAGLSAAPAGPSPAFRAALFERLEAEALLPPRRGRLLAFPAWRWFAVPLAAAAGLAFFLLAGRDAADRLPGGPPAGPQVARQELPAGAPASRPAEGSSGAARPQAAPAQPDPAGTTVSASPGSAPSGLSPEDAEIVAHLDLFEGADPLDEPPAGFDDLFAPASQGRG